jgi:hypothetical protein
MALDLFVDNIVNELALHNKFGSEVFEPPDLFGINYGSGLDVGSDIFKIVLPLAPVPDPVFGKGPGIYFREERVQLNHIFLLRTVAKYLPLLLLSVIKIAFKSPETHPFSKHFTTPLIRSLHGLCSNEFPKKIPKHHQGR